MSEGLGWGLNIDDKVFSRMNELENKLKSIATQSEATKNTFIAAFRDMGEQGVGALVSKLTEAQNKLTSLSNIKITGGVGNLGSEAAKSVDDVNKLVAALEQLKQKSSKNSFTDKQSFNTSTLQASIQEYGELSRKIVETSAKIDELQQKTRAYELEKQRISQGKSGMISPEMTKAYEKNLAELNALRESVAQWEKGRQNALALNQELAKQIQLLQGLKNYEQDRTSLPEQRKNKELQEMNKYYREQEKVSKALFDANQKLNKSNLQSYAKAMSASEGTITQRIAKIKQLEAVEKRLSSNQDIYQVLLNRTRDTIVRLTQENEKYISQQKRIKDAKDKLSISANALQRQLALVFSVSSIYGYMQNLVKIRGEFELQQKSLQVLLQNKVAADKLWQQTIDLAVQSPFRVKQLVTYTKQLAAYRVESDKLFDTTKRLADVSAGLGVDMQRLILAYGQVKAANFLRGTELRQFTEAGIPVLDELAKRFTALEGKTVSIGEVFSRISKRMVSFKDVAAVFENMTNKGGVFYKMQEEQAKTLHGVMNNLHDSIDLMINDIGRSHDGILKGAIETVRDLIENWRMVAIVIENVAAGMALIAVTNFISGWKQVALLGTKLQVTLSGASLAGAKLHAILSSLWTLLAAHPYVAVFAAAAAATYSMYRYANSIDAVNKRYVEMQKKELASIDSLDALNERIQENNKSIIESKKAGEINTDAIQDNAKALDELKTKYPDLASKVTQYTNGIVEMTKAYTEQNDILRANIALQEAAKGGWFQDDFSKNYRDLLEEKQKLDAAIQKTQGIAGIARAELYDYTKKYGETENTIEFEKLLKQIQDSKDLADFKEAKKNLRDFMHDTLGATSKLGQLGSKVTFSFLESSLTKFQGSLEDWQANIKNMLSTFNMEIDNIYKSAGVGNEEAAKKQVDQWVNDQLAKLGVVDETAKKLALEYINKNITIPFAIELVDEQGKVFKEEKLEDWQKRLWAAIQDVNKTSTRFKVNVGIEDIAVKGKEELISQLGGQLKEISTDLNKALSIKNVSSQIEFSEDDIKQAKAVEQYIEALKVLINYQEKSKGAGKDWASELIKSVSDAHKEFKNLNKTLDETAAKRLTLSKFSQVFKEAAKNAGINGINLGQLDFTTETGTVEALEFLLDKLPAAAKEARFKIKKAIGEIKGEITVKTKENTDEKLKEELDGLFRSYEATIELKKLNIPKDLAKNLFGVNYTELGDIKKRIEKEIQDITNSKGQENRLKSLKQYYDKIKDFETKEIKDIINKYAISTTTFDQQRAKLRRDYDLILKTIADANLGDAQSKEFVAALTNNMNRALGEINWKEFQDSIDYTAAFGDLDKVSTETLKSVYHQLDKLRSSAIANKDFANVKEFSRQMDELFNKIQSRGNVYENLNKQIDAYNISLNNQKQAVSEYLSLEQQYIQDEGKLSEEEKAARLKELSDKYNKARITADEYRNALKRLVDAEQKARETTKKFLSSVSDLAGNLFGSEIEGQINSLINLWDKFNDVLDINRQTLTESLDNFSDSTEALTDASKNVANEITKVGKTGEATVNAIGGVVDTTTNAITTTSKTATTAISTIEKASVILAIISAALQVFNAITNNSKEAEKEHQEYLQGIIDLQREYNKQLLETRLLHDDIFGANPFGNIIGDIGVAQEAMQKYNEAASAMQKQWTDPSHNFFGELWKGVTQAFGAVDVFDMGWGDWIRDFGEGVSDISNGINSASLGLTEAINNLRYITQKGSKGFLGIGSKGTKTQDLQTWVKENLGADLFDKDGLINLDIVNELLSSHTDRLTDDTRNTLETLKQYAEIIKEVEENIKSWAEDVYGDLSTNLANSLVEAFRNGTSAADDFGIHVKGIIETLGQQMLHNMLYSKVFSQYENALEDITKKYATGDYNDAQYIDKISALTSEIMDDSQDFLAVGTTFLQSLKDAAAQYGLDIYQATDSGNNLTGLQKGIQGVTEETAQIIEAYLNSMRFFVSDSNSKLTLIANSIASFNAETNPIISELKAQTEVIREINTLLNNVTAPHPTSGRGFKVVI